jgi:hypothetical protein
LWGSCDLVVGLAVGWFLASSGLVVNLLWLVVI